MALVLKDSTLLIAAFLIPLLSGCGSILSGNDQKISIESKPAGASVAVDRISVGKTPITVMLLRKTSHQVELNLEGYRHYEVTIEPKMNSAVYGNILLGGIIGAAIDHSNGAANTLHPEKIYAVLEKKH